MSGARASRNSVPRPAARCRRALRDDRGSGSVLAIGILTATIALSIALIAALGAFALHTRVSVAADAAALAAADTASHRVPGEPCARAHAAAALHGVELVACESGYRESVVTVSAGFGPLELSSSARAGLPR